MPDDTTQTGGADRIRIDVHDEFELRDWAATFGVTTAELKAAVRAVGTSAAAV